MADDEKSCLICSTVRRLRGLLARRQVSMDRAERWREQLGSRVLIGDGTRLGQSHLRATDPRGCRLEVGSMSMLDCSIILERAASAVCIGDRSFIGGGRTVLDVSKSVAIGNDVLVGFDVLIMDHDAHSLFFEERKEDVLEWLQGRKNWQCVSSQPVEICDKVWVGSRVTILKGVTIGEGAVIGASSVVTSSVEPWTLVAGNPARMIRRIPRERE